MLKRAIFIMVGVVFVVFILQNTQVLEVRFWFWKTQASRALVLLITFVVGLGIGYLAGVWKKSSSASARRSIATADSPPKKGQSSAEI